MVSIVMQGVDFFSLISRPPGSMFFVMILSAILSTVTSLITRLMTDTKELARKQEIIKEHQTQKKEIAQLEGENPKKHAKELIRWKRREKAVQKMQQSISMARLKPQCITTIPMIVLFFILNAFFGELPVALSPMNPASIPLIGQQATWAQYNAAGVYDPRWGWLKFVGWYFLCSFAIGGVIQRIFGVAQQTSMSQMLGGGQQGSQFNTKEMFRKKPN